MTAAARLVDIDSHAAADMTLNSERFGVVLGWKLNRSPGDVRTDPAELTPAERGLRVGLESILSEYGNRSGGPELVVYIRSCRSLDHGYRYGQPAAYDPDHGSRHPAYDEWLESDGWGSGARDRIPVTTTPRRAGPVMGVPVDWDEMVFASEVDTSEVRSGDHLEVHFRRAGELDELTEWLEVGVVGDGLWRVGGVPIQRGTLPYPAAVAIAAHLAANTGIETRVSAGRWVRE